MKNKVRTVKNSLEVMNSNIKQTPNFRGWAEAATSTHSRLDVPIASRDVRCLNDYRGDENQNHARAETKSRESNRNIEIGRSLELTGRTRRHRNTRTRTR